MYRLNNGLKYTVVYGNHTSFAWLFGERAKEITSTCVRKHKVLIYITHEHENERIRLCFQHCRVKNKNKPNNPTLIGWESHKMSVIVH